jgi:hypothetical protein
MAHQLLPLYQLDAAVGKGAPNRADDVRLVEALIEACLKGSGKAAIEQHAQNFGLKAPAAPPMVTGNYSQNLQDWINVLQALFKKFKFSNSLDGRIDPMPNAHSSSIDVETKTSRGSEYLLFQLNKLAINFGGSDAFLQVRDRAGVKYFANVGGKGFSF